LAAGLRFFAEDEGKLRLARVGWVVEGFGRAVAFGGFEVKTALHALREAGEAGFAVGVGANFQVELAGVHESVGDVNLDFGRVDGGAVSVRDREVCGTGPDPAVDCWNGLRVGMSGSGLRMGPAREEKREGNQQRQTSSNFRLVHIR